eukprot:727136-Rhodomonas_salina.3
MRARGPVGVQTLLASVFALVKGKLQSAMFSHLFFDIALISIVVPVHFSTVPTVTTASLNHHDHNLIFCLCSPWHMCQQMLNPTTRTS